MSYSVFIWTDSVPDVIQSVSKSKETTQTQQEPPQLSVHIKQEVKMEDDWEEESYGVSAPASSPSDTTPRAETQQQESALSHYIAQGAPKGTITYSVVWLHISNNRSTVGKVSNSTGSFE